MPYRETKFFNDCFYHIYNRGVNHSVIFFDPRNYYYFIDKLKQHLTPCSDIISYCLMPNHFHLLIRIKDDDKILSSLTKLFLSYSKSINKSKDRTGPLFEGRYQSKFIAEKEYLLHLTRYIHLNPVRATLVKSPEEWKYSSYQEYIGRRKHSFIVNDIILEHVKNYKEFVQNYQQVDKLKIAELLFHRYLEGGGKSPGLICLN